MQVKAPPIQWLPVFEAAARNLSFKLAADELCVTPPAISQQIKSLEAYLGIPLFERSTRRLRLTAAGEHYYAAARQIIRTHQQSYRELERLFKYPVLLVSAPLFITQELLIPNYLSFRDYAPNIDLRLSTGNDFVDFETQPVDAAIRFGRGQWPGVQARLLQRVEPCLVCSPAYLNKRGIDLAQTIDLSLLQKQVLLTIGDTFTEWKMLFPELREADRIVCDSYFSIIKSAQEGLGIAVGILPVISRQLREGSLVRLNSAHQSADLAYWLVVPERATERPGIEPFYRWLKDLFERFAQTHVVSA